MQNSKSTGTSKTKNMIGAAVATAGALMFLNGNGETGIAEGRRLLCTMMTNRPKYFTVISMKLLEGLVDIDVPLEKAVDECKQLQSKVAFTLPDCITEDGRIVKVDEKQGKWIERSYVLENLSSDGWDGNGKEIFVPNPARATLRKPTHLQKHMSGKMVMKEGKEDEHEVVKISESDDSESSISSTKSSISSTKSDSESSISESDDSESSIIDSFEYLSFGREEDDADKNNSGRRRSRARDQLLKFSESDEMSINFSEESELKSEALESNQMKVL